MAIIQQKMTSSIDERKQLEEAIASLETQRDMLGDAAVDAAIVGLRQKLRDITSKSAPQQRKQITVIFADVSGFTALSDSMDAEDVTEIMNDMWQRLDAIIMEHGGKIDKHIGDAVMAMWGVETVREDDAERAVRAAIAMQNEIKVFTATASAAIRSRQNGKAKKFKSDNLLQMRIGINSGAVLLGAVGITGEYTAMGDTVNVAHHIEQAAPIGSVMISRETYRLVRGIFDVEKYPSLDIKGKSDLVDVYIAQRAKPRRFRTSTRGIEGSETRMIGRESELQRLKNGYHDVKHTSKTKIVTIIGDAGVGKSRLLYEFNEWLDGLSEQIVVVRGRSFPELMGQPYTLARNIFAKIAGIQDTDTRVEVRTKLETAIAAVLGDERPDKAHYIAHLIGYDVSDSSVIQQFGGNAEQLHRVGLHYLLQYASQAAKMMNVVLFCDDMHWIDLKSLEILRELVSAHPELPLFVVGVARPTLFERVPNWGENIFDDDVKSHFDSVWLHPLSDNDTEILLAELLKNPSAIPTELRDLIIENAEGNPFYVEELIKMLISDGVIKRSTDESDSQWQVEMSRLEDLRVPTTLRGVLQARLDSLPKAERALLQKGSVIGRIFWDKAVERLNVDEDTTEAWDTDALNDIIERELVYPRAFSTFTGTHEYIFKHALFRDTAYETVLRSHRRIYHRQAAEWLIEVSGARVNEYANLIAEHFAQADQPLKAAGWYRRAGRQATAQFANTEAVRCFTRAIELIPPENTTERYELLLAREQIYNLQGKRQTQTLDLDALGELAEILNDDDRRAEVALRKAIYAYATGDYPVVVSAAQKAVELANTTKSTESEAAGHYWWGQALLQQAEYPTARPELELALLLAKQAKLPRIEGNCLRSLGLLASMQGDHSTARRYYEQALRLSRATGDRLGESDTLEKLGDVAQSQGDFIGARAYYEQALVLCRETGNRRGERSALINLGAGAANQGDNAKARSYYEQALRISRETTDPLGESSAYANLGDIAISQGDYPSAQRYLTQAIRIFKEIGDPIGEHRSLRNLGVVACYQGAFETSKIYLERALQFFKEVGNPQGESDALAFLAMMYHYQGDNTTARNYAQNALTAITDVGARSERANALTHLAHALVELGQYEAAADSYRQALTLRYVMAQINLVQEPVAGLARIALETTDKPEALRYAKQILHHLESKTLEGTEEPFRVYLTCYQALAANDDDRANGFLEYAHHELKTWAERIKDDALRTSFLTNIPAHRELVQSWEKLAK